MRFPELVTKFNFSPQMTFRTTWPMHVHAWIPLFHDIRVNGLLEAASLFPSQDLQAMVKGMETEWWPSVKAALCNLGPNVLTDLSTNNAVYVHDWAVCKSIPFPQLLWRKFPVSSEAGNEGLQELMQGTMWFLASTYCARTMKWNILGYLKHQGPDLNLIRNSWNSADGGRWTWWKETGSCWSSGQGMPWLYHELALHSCVYHFTCLSLYFSTYLFSGGRKIFLTSYQVINETPGTKETLVAL